MQSSIRKPLWAAFGTLLALLLVAGALNFALLRYEREFEKRQSGVYERLIEAVMRMEGEVNSMLAAARGYTITRQPTFLDRYQGAVRSFERTAASATEIASDPRDLAVIVGFTRYFREMRTLSDRQIALIDEGEISDAVDTMLRAEQRRWQAEDFGAELIERERNRRAEELSTLETLRLALTVLLVLMSVAMVLIAVWMVLRTERSIETGIARQIRRTEAIIAGMADGVMLMNAEGQVVYLNPAGVRILGTEELDLGYGDEQSQLFRSSRGRPLPAHQLPSARALRTGIPVEDAEVVVSRADGEMLRVSMNAVPLQEDGQIGGVIVSFRDVTERHELEMRLADAATNANALAEAGKSFAREIHPARLAAMVARHAADALGEWAAVVLRDSGTDQLLLAAIHHQDAQRLHVARDEMRRHSLRLGEGAIGAAVQRGFPAILTDYAAGPEEGERSQTATFVLPLRARGEVFGALVVGGSRKPGAGDELRVRFAEDLAERAALGMDNARLYAEQVAARENMEDLSRLKDEFLSIASHELRTPVTSIKGYTQLARVLIRDRELKTAEDYLGVALDQIDRMSRLILELLDVSRIETGRLDVRSERIDWGVFLRRIMRFRQTAAPERSFRLVLEQEPLQVCGDRDRLEQVIGNLIDNAVKYSGPDDEILIRSGTNGEGVYTSVVDHGIGIPPDELRSVFDRFHRGKQVSSTHYGGLGLGLYIARQIIERHGGSISAESHPEKGTSFTFTIPSAEPSEHPDAQESQRL